MCLSFLSDKVKQKYKKKKFGWKIFKIGPNKELKNYIYNNKMKLLENRWLKEETFRQSKFRKTNFISTDCESYEMGFHIFLTKKDAMLYNIGYSIKRVKFRKPVAYGLQGGSLKVVVAKEMLIQK